MKTYQNLHVVSLQAENIKRLRAVRIDPTGSLVEITGENGAGKTSTLDCIFWALGGAAEIQSDPIRHGEESAIIRLDFGEIRVTRRFNRKEGGGFSTDVYVEGLDGARFQQPQRILDGLVSRVSFDPMDFLREKPAAQFDALKVFVPGFDFEANKGKRDGAFARRTETKRQLGDATSRASGIRVPDGVWEAIDESALVDELDAAGRTNAEIEARKGRRQAMEDRLEQVMLSAGVSRDDIKRLEERLVVLRETLAEEERSIREIRARLDNADPLPEPVDTTAVRERIDRARDHNAAVRHAKAQAAEKARLTAEVETLTATVSDLTEDIAARDKEKADAIAAADLPVPGLTFGDGEILLDGAPFAQASTAQQIRTSVAIAMAGNPAIRVARVKDGSLLSKTSWAALIELAEANNFQVWVETVESDRATAILIEDGTVAGEPMPEPIETAPKPRARKAAPQDEPAAAPAAAKRAAASDVPWEEPSKPEPEPIVDVSDSLFGGKF